VLAAETDRVFSGDWLGVELEFFRPDRQQPERFSKLMKASFRKHIPKVESALRLVPDNNGLWNIWAWMASSLPDYKWAFFVNSFELADFSVTSAENTKSIPSSEACAWIAAKALGEKDWATVIKFAPLAKWFSNYYGEKKDEWLPGGRGSMQSVEPIEGYPIKSAYAPLLEALLRIGDIDGAKKIFNEMLYLSHFNSSSIRAERAAIAAEVAKIVGMDELAALWEKGEPLNRMQFKSQPSPWLLVHEPRFSGFKPRNNDGEAFYKQLIGVDAKVFSMSITNIQELTERGFEIEGGSGWWALISADGQVLTQDSAIPSLEDMQAIFDRFNIKSRLELYKKYIADYGSSPGIELDIAFEIFANLTRNAESSGGGQDENILAESAWYLNKVLREHPNAMVYLPEIYFNAPASWLQIELLKSLSKPMLANIELLLFNKPSSEPLWLQWILWKNIEASDRSLETMVDSVKLSPLAKTGTVPPIAVIDMYYEECKKNGSWAKVIGLLKTAWDREFTRLNNPDLGWRVTSISNIGDRLGFPLIEAYLQDNKPGEANEIFNAVLGIGGKFTDISKILDLTKEKGYDRLAREWGEKVNK
jgi:pentatricopeptide repeat protein